jgi:hypothetical protein
MAFSITASGVAVPMSLFPQMVDSVELWQDNGATGQFDPAVDTLLSSKTASLSGDGNLVVPMESAQIAPLQTIRRLVTLKFKADAAGLNGFVMSWAGDHSGALQAYATADIGFGSVIPAQSPPVSRTIQLSSLTPLQQWRLGHWGSPDEAGPGANAADPDGDDLTNIIEYVMGGDPNSAGDAGLTSFFDAQGRFVVATALSDPPRPDATILVETSPSMQAGTWTVFAQRIGAGAWTGPAIVTPGAAQNGLQALTFSESSPQSPRLFVRLRVTTP